MQYICPETKEALSYNYRKNIVFGIRYLDNIIRENRSPLSSLFLGGGGGETWAPPRHCTSKKKPPLGRLRATPRVFPSRKKVNVWHTLLSLFPSKGKGKETKESIFFCGKHIFSHRCIQARQDTTTDTISCSCCPLRLLLCGRRLRFPRKLWSNPSHT